MVNKTKIPKPRVIAPFFQSMVTVYFDFCKEKFNTVPSFDGGDPRNLKNIVVCLQKRAKDKEVEWTLDVATHRLRLFLEYCYNDMWLREHFLLVNLDRQKDRLFFNINKQHG